MIRELAFLCKFFGGVGFFLYPLYRVFRCAALGGDLNPLSGMAICGLVFLIGALVERILWENEQFSRLAQQLEQLKARMNQLEEK